jgi:hypothetical protein
MSLGTINAKKYHAEGTMQKFETSGDVTEDACSILFYPGTIH